jgi:hypothetical protein
MQIIIAVQFDYNIIIFKSIIVVGNTSIEIVQYFMILWSYSIRIICYTFKTFGYDASI